jgi:asparagine synthase (glutamine-hydrolysing)
MCGLSGIADLDRTIDPAVIARMGASMVHRGPDQGGTYVDQERGLGVGFATRRLAILDLSEAGSQPMQTPDQRLCIAYNGEIYNEPELRLGLARRGCQYRSHSDTESVLYAYQEYGLAALSQLNGMFALAIHDRPAQRLILARDRMGIKPLYYSWNGRRLVFASELRTLLWNTDIAPVPDPDGLDAYLTCGYVPAPYSLIRGVRKLPPGSVLTLDANGHLEIRPFWRPSISRQDRLSGADAAAAVHGTVHDAVRRQMRSDVPVGVLLSGGVDSTIIAASAAAQTDHQLNTFTIAFHSRASAIADEYNADADFARRVAETLGASHHQVVCDDTTNIPALLQELVVGLDEPVWELSFISIYLMSRLARQHGVKVLLTGDGSDEIFAGYPWIAAAWRQQQYERLPLLKQGLSLATRTVPKSSTLYAHAKNLLATVGQSDVARYEHTHAIFNRAERRAMTGRSDPGVDGSPIASIVEPLLAGLGESAAPDRVALLDLTLWVRDHFNQRVDRMTMLNSVEARVPFQDNAVVDLALRLPFLTKAPFGRSKALLKRAFRREIPAFVLERPKRPFAAPQWAWGTGTLRSFAHETLSEDRVRAVGLIDPSVARKVLQATDTTAQDRSTFKLWTLLMLHVWAEQLRRPTGPTSDVCTAEASRVSRR